MHCGHAWECQCHGGAVGSAMETRHDSFSYCVLGTKITMFRVSLGRRSPRFGSSTMERLGDEDRSVVPRGRRSLKKIRLSSGIT